MAVSNNKPFDGLSHDEPLKGDRDISTAYC